MSFAAEQDLLVRTESETVDGGAFDLSDWNAARSELDDQMMNGLRTTVGRQIFIQFEHHGVVVTELNGECHIAVRSAVDACTYENIP